MKSNSLRKKFINFFVSKNHKYLPSASLVPEDDPTILFTPAGMSPLVRYLMGEPHPLGERLCSVQKCLRTDDIQEVGDLTHFTFFEMLGNWSLGDYFKKEAINWSFEFIIGKKWLAFNPKKVYVTVFAGDKDASKDNESIKIWQEVFAKVGIKAEVGDKDKPDFTRERIFCYGKKENWWGPVGKTGPCGPDTEMFYDTGKPHDQKYGPHCHPNCECGRFFEFWNDVFMQYYKDNNSNITPLKQKNVDTGMGLERVVALTEYIENNVKNPDPFLTDLFIDIIKLLEEESGQNYQENKANFRTISDHLRAVVFIISDGVRPSNKDRGYILRRLIRRTVDSLSFIGIYKQEFYSLAIKKVIDIYSSAYTELDKFQEIKNIVLDEVEKYLKILRQIKKLAPEKKLTGEQVFTLFTTHGVSPEQLRDQGYKFDNLALEKKMKEHQKVSKKGMGQKFSGGLQDHSSEVVKLHTATHLLHQSLRSILKGNIQQVGSNINRERLRFDFTFSRSLTKNELKKVEELVNKKIEENLEIKFSIMSLKQAREQNALAFFGQKYPEKVKVYSIGNFSKEVCGGPHVDFTGELGKFIIKKEESCGAGKRRIYAILA